MREFLTKVESLVLFVDDILQGKGTKLCDRPYDRLCILREPLVKVSVTTTSLSDEIDKLFPDHLKELMPVDFYTDIKRKVRDNNLYISHLLVESYIVAEPQLRNIIKAIKTILLEIKEDLENVIDDYESYILMYSMKQIEQDTIKL